MPRIAFIDIETTRVNWKDIASAEPTVICLQLVETNHPSRRLSSASSTHQLFTEEITLLRAKTMETNEFDVVQDMNIIQQLRYIFLDPNTTVLVAFNGLRFDFPILKRYCQFNTQEFEEIVQPKFYDPFHATKLNGIKGSSLNNIALLNGIDGKTGSGAHAPLLWERDEYQKLCLYCMNDVVILKELCLKGNVQVPTRRRKGEREADFTPTSAYHQSLIPQIRKHEIKDIDRPIDQVY